MLHILLVDTHAVFRAALAVVLARHLERPVIAQVPTLVESQRHLPPVDLVVVAMERPDEMTADLLRVLRGGSRQSRVVVLVPAVTPAATLMDLQAEADAVVSTGASVDELLSRIAQVATEAGRDWSQPLPRPARTAC
jgi:DNA-binding NarL/FixJ family response regulator